MSRDTGEGEMSDYGSEIPGRSSQYKGLLSLMGKFVLEGREMLRGHMKRSRQLLAAGSGGFAW
jgi:hypothetical protein